MESEKVWRPRMEIERVWRPRVESERAWRPRARMEIEREWRLRGKGQECRVQKRITELHLTLDSPANFGPGGNATSRQWSGAQACHKRPGNQRDCRSGQNIGWKRYVKDKLVNQEARIWTRSGEIQRAMRKKEMTVPGSPI